MANIAVKDWWYRKEQDKAGCYNWTLCWEYVYGEKNKDGNYTMLATELGKQLFEIGKADRIGYILVGEKIKETAKAVQYRLKYWNLNKAGRYVTDAPVEDKWLTWIPKSVLL